MSDRRSATSSGLLTADTAVYDKPALITSVIVIGDGTNAATLVVYDNASAASGTALAKIVVDAGLTYEKVVFSTPVVANQGLYADVTGTGAEFIVHYTPC